MGPGDRNLSAPSLLTIGAAILIVSGQLPGIDAVTITIGTAATLFGLILLLSVPKDQAPQVPESPAITGG